MLHSIPVAPGFDKQVFVPWSGAGKDQNLHGDAETCQLRISFII